MLAQPTHRELDIATVEAQLLPKGLRQSVKGELGGWIHVKHGHRYVRNSMAQNTAKKDRYLTRRL